VIIVAESLRMASPSDAESTGLSGYPDPNNPFSPTSIFSVDDLVVVITGGGTGECQKQPFGLTLLEPRLICC
jgi:hypothetical protein